MIDRTRLDNWLHGEFKRRAEAKRVLTRAEAAEIAQACGAGKSADREARKSIARLNEAGDLVTTYDRKRGGYRLVTNAADLQAEAARLQAYAQAIEKRRRKVLEFAGQHTLGAFQ